MLTVTLLCGLIEAAHLAGSVQRLTTNFRICMPTKVLHCRQLIK